MATRYIDYANGNNSADGSTFDLSGLPTVGPWRDMTNGATAARIAPGDIIKLSTNTNCYNANGVLVADGRTTDPSSVGQTALWTNKSRDVVLQSAAVTAEIDYCESTNANWVKSTNITGSDTTTYFKAGSNALQLSVPNTFTGKIAYRDFGAGNVKDLSGYQQISFWIRNNVALTAVGDISIKLCSDATGDGAVNTFLLPAIPCTNNFVALTLNYGSALGSSIRSISIWMNQDRGAINLVFDNIIACKARSAADSITLTSLISKNSAKQGGAEHWYPIQSIIGTTIKIDNHNNCLGNAGRGYSGTTETVAIYKRECILTDITTGSANTFTDSGNATAYIEYQGGYNSSTGIQDGETLFCGSAMSGNGLYWVDNHYNRINWVGFVRYYNGITINSANQVLDDLRNIRLIGCNYAWNAGSYHMRFIFGDLYVNNNNYGILSNVGIIECLGSSIWRIAGNMNYGLNNGGIYNKFVDIDYKNNGDSIWVYCADTLINNLTSVDNAGYVFYLRGGKVSVKSLTYNETTIAGSEDYLFHHAAITNINGSFGGRIIKGSAGTIYADTIDGYTWKFCPTNSGLSAINPLRHTVAQIACAANQQVTVSAMMKRDNTGLNFYLVCPGGQIAGVPSDVSANVTSGADIWQQVTLTFTPSEAGVVDIEVRAWGGTTYSGWIDNMQVTQAGGPTRSNILKMDLIRLSQPWVCAGAGAESGGGGNRVIGSGIIIPRGGPC